jgi:mersacidin/lichenicidin family type 2 lantibiotic
MPISEIVRAWRDEEFRSSLSTSEISRLPDHPVGTIELKDGDLVNTSVQATFSAIRTQCTFCCE